MDEVDRARAAWGFFRDRRTDLYGSLVGPQSDKG
jgi:N-carbamoylputrescine amidase